MATASPASLRSVSDTALIVAYHRVMESERPDALFRDPYARRLIGERGEQIVRKLRWGRGSSFSTIARTVLLDEMILRLLSSGSYDTVLNLAAGLDARPYRMELPASLHWVEVDFPEMVAYKQEHLAGDTPKCRLERIAFDLREQATRQQLFGNLGATSRGILVITEGLLVYLEPDHVRELAADLHQEPKIGAWLTDIAVPLVMQRTNKWWGKQLKAANAVMKFAPAEGTEFFRPLGWEEAEFGYIFQTAVRIKREMPFAWMIKAQVKLFPQRSARKMKQWRTGVAMLRRPG
jgi:methyltransferase (TIGR00027 family)